jgi:hypothetical protein
MFFKILSRFLANRALKFQKNSKNLKTFSSQNLKMGNKTTQDFKLIWNLLRKMQKFANKKVTGKRSVQNWSLSSSILLTCTSFWQITFSGYTFFNLFPQI